MIYFLSLANDASAKQKLITSSPKEIMNAGKYSVLESIFLVFLKAEKSCCLNSNRQMLKEVVGGEGGGGEEGREERGPGGILSHTSYIGMCHCEGYSFQAV